MVVGMIITEKREVTFMPDGVIAVATRSLRMAYGQHFTQHQITHHEDSPHSPVHTGTEYVGRGVVWGEGDLARRPEKRSSMFMNTGLSVQLQKQQ